MSTHASSGSIGSYSFPFVDRVDECRLICHPDISGLRDGNKAFCVVVSKQPGAGKTYLGKECLNVALNNPPEGCDSKDWRTRLPVCTLYCEATRRESLAGVLTRVARCGMRKVDSLWADKEKIENDGRCEVVQENAYGLCDTSEILEAGEVGKIVARLRMRKRFLNLTEETDMQFLAIVDQLEEELEQKPLTRWASIVHDIVRRRRDANKISEWLSVKARPRSVEAAARCLEETCKKWNELYCTSSRPAALLIVIDEAQRVLPGEEEEEEEEEEEIKKEKRLLVREQLKKIFGMMEPVFRRARFLWTGVSSAAVDFQMSRGDQGTDFRVVSVALPPLDIMQWAEAMEGTFSALAKNLMEEIIGEVKAKAAARGAWADIFDEFDETKQHEEFKRRTLMEMMSCTGGWPREVREFVFQPNKKTWDWITEVFGSSKRQQQMEYSTTQLLDLAYLAPDMNVLELMESIDRDDSGRVFYELLHTSGMRLVTASEEAPAIYVPNSIPGVVGVKYTSNLEHARLRHTTGSLLLQARLRKQTAIYARRGQYEAFTHNPAEEATINTLSHLDTFDGCQLKDVFPWLKERLPNIAEKCLESRSLQAFRGLVVNDRRGLLSHDAVPANLVDHKDKKTQIKPDEFKEWLTRWCGGCDESFVPFLYVFGPLSASGDILLVLKDLHIHVQVKNAVRDDWKGELAKMKAVASEEVANIFLLVNYYDKEKGMPMSFVEMSTRPHATIRGVCRETGKREVDVSTEFSEKCLVADLQGLWQKRLAKNVEEETALDVIGQTPSDASAMLEAAASVGSEHIEEQPRKRPRFPYAPL